MYYSHVLFLLLDSPQKCFLLNNLILNYHSNKGNILPPENCSVGNLWHDSKYKRIKTAPQELCSRLRASFSKPLQSRLWAFNFRKPPTMARLEFIKIK